MIEIILINTKHPTETTTISIKPKEVLNQECFIGRDKRCCMALNDVMVSRIHGKIAYHQGIYYYADLGSSNGSLLNNKTIKVNQNYPLKPLDTLTLGNHLVCIKEIKGIQAQQPQTQKYITPQEYMPLINVSPNSLTPWTQGKLEVTCIRVVEETHDVKTFSFVANPPVLFSYQPGQFISLDLKIGKKSVKRSYSISSSPSRPHTLDITVKRVLAPAEAPNIPPGLVSNWLHDNIKIGSKIKLNPPTGKFTNFTKPSPKLLLVSSGSGITPMMSMARWICDTASKVNITFIYCARSPRDIIFRQELELMAGKYPNFKLAITLTRPQLGETWYGYTGRLNKSMLSAIAPDYQERSTYVCGSNPFMASVKSILHELNFSMENYHEESFGFPKKAVSPSSTKTKSAILSELMNSPITIPAFKNGKKSLHNYTTEHVLTAGRNARVLSSSTNHFKSSSAVITPPKKSVTTTSIVQFAKSGREIVCESEESILDVAQAQGIEIPYGCGMGICGQCKLTKLEGEVMYDDDDVECEANEVLTCVGKARGKVIIDA